MAALKMTISCFFFLQVISCLLSLFAPTTVQGLKVGFYDKACPKAELIVKKFVFEAVKKDPTLGAPLLRMFFHDCFVRGCEGSVLLELKNKKDEKNAIPNLTLRGFEIIDNAKAALEKECPGIVSCSDVLALVARDAMVALNGPSWEVETGRRDGLVTNINEALLNLPSPFNNISSLITQFQSKGLDKKDLVVLSGGHTIGHGHCPQITNRLYNFTGKGDSDPNLDTKYAANLRRKCKPTDTTTALEMDPGSFKTFDESYFKLVSQRRGLFQSDAALLDNQETKSYLLKHVNSDKSTFFKDFGVSMVKMGRIGVLTGQAGEVRKKCRMVN
ncbi:hem peroxidase [Arabidopsis thaliana x Arabidopsis arenosa]|uniref:peroxidase n=1 Tax=Arabidopsis thaliana x Arabidopsis arenosa TaxID=1240361 RepID=A0A8T1YX56_9BRAS|nr:hem peroxidase [Arabidopsis thaliana x Arabidopsis arenosa]